MNFSSIPTRFPIPFANSGTRTTIPTASQIGITPGAASLTDGFPPRTFHALPPTSDGVPPFGADFNGIFYEVTGTQQWQNAGSTWPYDSAFSTAIAGYPMGAVLIRADGTGFWMSLVDANTTNPDAGGANWIPLNNYGVTALTGLAASNVTLTALQSAKTYITFAGTLTANINIIFPTLFKSWIVINNTTGAFTITCKTASGGGATADQGLMNEFYGDGTSIVKYPFLTTTSAAATYLTIANAASTYLSLATAASTYLTISSAAGTYQVANATIGIAQTWTNVTGSRASGTTYTNSTGKAIQVVLYLQTNGASGSVSFAIGGVTIGSPTWGSVGAGNLPYDISAIVPNGQTYVLTVSAGSLVTWVELR